MEINIDFRKLYRCFWLQWGHNFFVMEMICHICIIEQIYLLQWGHNFFVMEISIFLGHLCALLVLQWGHNFFVMEISVQVSVLTTDGISFNGAITFSLWKFGLSVAVVFGVPSFNGAITFSLWKSEHTGIW